MQRSSDLAYRYQKNGYHGMSEDRRLRRLKLRDLHVLEVVAEAGSMAAKAAPLLAMSQPAVSRKSLPRWSTQSAYPCSTAHRPVLNSPHSVKCSANVRLTPSMNSSRVLGGRSASSPPTRLLEGEIRIGLHRTNDDTGSHHSCSECPRGTQGSSSTSPLRTPGLFTSCCEIERSSLQSSQIDIAAHGRGHPE